jgi:membrane-associated phospholipid phosphatase
MLLAIPSEGHHYLIDVIAGAAVAVLCIAAFRMTAPEINRPPLPVARTSVPA